MDTGAYALTLLRFFIPTRRKLVVYAVTYLALFLITGTPQVMDLAFVLGWNSPLAQTVIEWLTLFTPMRYSFGVTAGPVDFEPLMMMGFNQLSFVTVYLVACLLDLMFTKIQKQPKTSHP